MTDLPPCGTVHDPDEPLVGDRVEAVRWFYVAEYCDGPASGMVTVEGRGELWAQCRQECSVMLDADDGSAESVQPCGFHRRYQLVDLTPAAAAVQAERHADFERWVGENWCRHLHGSAPGPMRRQPELARYYAKWPPGDDTAPIDGELVGWFEE